MPIHRVVLTYTRGVKVGENIKEMISAPNRAEVYDIVKENYPLCTLKSVDFIKFVGECPQHHIPIFEDMEYSALDNQYVSNLT
jgi:hypothetical protein